METKDKNDTKTNFKDIDMAELAIKTGNDIKELAAALASFPAPDKWTVSQKTQAVQFAALLNAAQNMITVKNIMSIDYETEKRVFLDNAGHSKSVHTRLGYAKAIERLELWAVRHNIDLLRLSPMQADDFIYSLKAGELHKDGKTPAPSSIRRDTAAASSFYTFFHRRHAAVTNPFRGTKARPPQKTVKETVIPKTVKEIKLIIAALPPMEAAAVSIMAYRGLRAGALPTLSITGTAFKAHSKGKDIQGTLSPDILKALETAGLDAKKPFEGITPNTLEHKIARAIKKLHKAGKIKALYSCHDFRHFYAVTEYRKNKDIHRLSKLMGHASIQVTETYLKGLGEID
jgi:site-specific recombinase XerD